jgi:hypothetical protein
MYIGKEMRMMMILGLGKIASMIKLLESRFGLY